MIYMDAASTSYIKPEAVYQAVDHTLRHAAGNAGRGANAAALGASGILFDARKELMEFFGASAPEYVVFKASVTDALNTLLLGLLKKGDHVISSVMEHNSVLRPLEHLKRQGLITYDLLPADAQGRVQMRALEDLERPNTRAVVLSHVSNLTGTIQDVESVRTHLRSPDIFLIVDVAQSAGYLPVTLGGFTADAMAFTGHKGLLGPQGTGGFVLTPRLNEAISPVFTGGTGSHSLSLEQPEFLPDKFESGTQNTPGIAGLLAGVTHLRALDFSAIRSHQEALMRHFLQGISSWPFLTVQGPESHVHRLPVFSLKFKDMDPSMVAFRLEMEHHIITRSGLHCAGKAHVALGTSQMGTLRASFGHFTQTQDVDVLLNAIKSICGDTYE